MSKSDFFAALTSGQIACGKPIVVVNVGEIVGVVGMITLLSIAAFVIWKATK